MIIINSHAYLILRRSLLQHQACLRFAENATLVPPVHRRLTDALDVSRHPGQCRAFHGKWHYRGNYQAEEGAAPDTGMPHDHDPTTPLVCARGHSATAQVPRIPASQRWVRACGRSDASQALGAADSATLASSLNKQPMRVTVAGRSFTAERTVVVEQPQPARASRCPPWQPRSHSSTPRASSTRIVTKPFCLLPCHAQRRRRAASKRLLSGGQRTWPWRGAAQRGWCCCCSWGCGVRVAVARARSPRIVGASLPSHRGPHTDVDCTSS